MNKVKRLENFLKDYLDYKLCYVNDEDEWYSPKTLYFTSLDNVEDQWRR